MTAARIAAHFGRAAADYDHHAQVQLAAARTLLSLLPEQAAGIGVDLGAATGPVAERLQRQCPRLRWLALDLSLPMLEEGRQRGRFDAAFTPLCADARALPLAAGSVQLLYSSFALQWCPQLPALLAELRRVLAPDGLLALCVPVAGSLVELQQAWAAVDDDVHVNPLPSRDDWAAAAAAGGWAPEHWHQAQVREFYPSVAAVGQRQRATGAHYVPGRARAGLLPPSRYRAMAAAYEQQRQPQGLPLTWELLYTVLTPC